MSRIRTVLLVVVLLSAVTSPATEAAAPLRPPILISELGHAIEGRTLTVTGLVRNLGPQPIARLVIDASGFGPSGELVTAGSDGVPWVLAPGAGERFTITMPIQKRLVREYVVQAAQSTPPFTPITTVRRGVDVALYRPLILSMIQLRAQVQGGSLVLKATTEDLPVTHVTAQVTLLLTNVLTSVLTDQFEAVTLRVDVPANSSQTIFLGTLHALLLSARVSDFRLRSAWSD
jgi:hypothetical protein